MTKEYKHKVLKNSQERAYGDTIKIVELYLEEGLTKEQASDIARDMNIGFNDSKNRDWYEPKLSYFKETFPGVWEFKTISEYTG